ncbi:MAG TPA: response regulator transcription factor [Candidatus Sulfotelmatobacter sp.]|jgi:CheY-like chemotaxis protein|nr:response regulator transcription factor [Candidatus Sulfotelmatobacter sp.]
MSTRILIADDNSAVRTALRSLLVAAGPFEVVDVANGQEAVAKAQELKPNLIILDLVMPVMDGFKAARELSQLMPAVPMLMHTLHWSPQVELEAQKLGVRKVISKSDARLLISTVQEILLVSPPNPDPEALPLSINIPAPTAGPPAAVLETSAAESSENPGEPSPSTGDAPPSSQTN